MTTFSKLPQVRAEAKRRGMRVHMMRWSDGPHYAVWADHWNGVNLQKQQGDVTPELGWPVAGLPALLAWANQQWGA